MDIQVIDCIRKYVKEKYSGGGVIKVSDVSAYCNRSEGALIRELVNLEDLGEVKIERRYSCPDFHYVRDNDFPFCIDCNREYPEELINVYFYFKPLAGIRG